ncbi:MAG TPA: hypothetical protein VM008_17340 [Phycisphaerae bacterium]|nr:hypothetical protein [Phycisphaerae bacterium]
MIDGRGLQDSRTIDGECRKLLLSCSDRLEGAALAMVAAIAAAMVNGSHRSRVRAPEPEIRWLPLKDAARHFGLSVGHVRRKCGHEWMCQGKAQLRTGGGIKPRWIVRSDAYPAPAREYLGTAPASSPVPANL